MLDKLKTAGIYIGGTVIIVAMIVACIGMMMVFNDRFRCLGLL